MLARTVFGGTVTERRTARRYDLSLPVVIRIAEDKGSASRSGKTRDISTHGVYFLIENELAPGAEIDLTMTLPAEVTGGTEVFIRATGRVVRLEKKAERSTDRLGVAAVIERYDIVRSEAVAS